MLFFKHSVLGQICNFPLEFVWWIFSILFSMTLNHIFSNGDADDCMVHGRKEKKKKAGQMSGSNLVLYET